MFGGTFIEDSYNDLINGNNTKEDDADPEEIISRIKGKLARIESGKEDSHGPVSVKG